VGGDDPLARTSVLTRLGTHARWYIRVPPTYDANWFPECYAPAREYVGGSSAIECGTGRTGRCDSQLPVGLACVWAGGYGVVEVVAAPAGAVVVVVVVGVEPPTFGVVVEVALGAVVLLGLVDDGGTEVAVVLVVDVLVVVVDLGGGAVVVVVVTWWETGLEFGAGSGGYWM
jgi:hypothetical protein